jgi:hypothetical protein
MEVLNKSEPFAQVDFHSTLRDPDKKWAHVTEEEVEEEEVEEEEEEEPPFPPHPSTYGGFTWESIA